MTTNDDSLSLDHATVAEQLSRLTPWDLPFVVFDVETTGLVHTRPDADESTPLDRVVELAAIRFDAGEVTARVHARLNPGRPIPAEATAIHGIGDADVQEAPAFSEVWPQIVALYDSPFVSTVAYNAEFDRAFARVEVATASLDVKPLGLPWIDPLVFVRKFDRFVKGSGRHKLGATCARRGVALDNAHSAEADAIAAGKLWIAMKREVCALMRGAVNVTSVLRMQSALAEAQERDFAAYKARMAAKGAA